MAVLAGYGNQCCVPVCDFEGSESGRGLGDCQARQLLVDFARCGGLFLCRVGADLAMALSVETDQGNSFEGAFPGGGDRLHGQQYLSCSDRRAAQCLCAAEA